MKALKHVYNIASNRLKGKELELLLVILPDSNGPLYGECHLIAFLHMFSPLRSYRFGNITLCLQVTSNESVKLIWD
jgi:hypothetical protein